MFWNDIPSVTQRLILIIIRTITGAAAIEILLTYTQHIEVYTLFVPFSLIVFNILSSQVLLLPQPQLTFQ